MYINMPLQQVSFVMCDPLGLLRKVTNMPEGTLLYKSCTVNVHYQQNTQNVYIPNGYVAASHMTWI